MLGLPHINHLNREKKKGFNEPPSLPICEPGTGTYSDSLLLAIGTLSTLFPPLEIMMSWHSGLMSLWGVGHDLIGDEDRRPS